MRNGGCEVLELKQENASKLFEEMCNIIQVAPTVKDIEIQSPRVIKFTVNEKEYRIEWYWNQSYLYFENDAMFLFQRVWLSSTWPNRYMANLQFTQRDETIAVIPLVPYENQ